MTRRAPPKRPDRAGSRRLVNVFSETDKPALFSTPAASSGHADTETGTEHAANDKAEQVRQALFALDAMRERGLIPERDYARRRAEIEAGRVAPED